MKLCYRFAWMLWSCGLFFIVKGANDTAWAQSGAAISANTKSGFKKANQSKVFYYDSQWWAIAFDEPDNRWYIWRYGSGQWLKTCKVIGGPANHCDAVVNPAAGKLYVLSSHKTSPRFWRFSYAGGTWNKDAGYPAMLTDFTNNDQNNPVSLVAAKNGELWIFRIAGNKLQAKRSSNDGQSWSATIDVKTGLTAAKGITDAAAFFAAGNDYVGVAYVESDVPGSKAGFLRHRDGEPDATWTDESDSLTFFGNERALNNICLTVDGSNNVYLITRNLGVTGSLPRNTLYKRLPLGGGIWKKYKVNTNSFWFTPVIAIDGANSRLYCMGVNQTTKIAEYKSCPLAQEATLDTATVFTLLSSPGASFDQLSVPAANVDAISGLMVCGANTTASDIWYRHIAIGNPAPLNVGTVSLSSNQVNANAAYTIPLTLSSAGALAAGIGTINFRFAVNTLVPDSIAPNQVLVNGTPAASIISNRAMRQVTITTPANLANNQSFSVVFNAGAGLLNPTTPKDYRVQAWTSAQPKQILSPPFDLVSTTTTVTPATVSLVPSLPDSCANYTIAFNLGPQGRLLAGTSTFMLMFNAATTIANGALSGVQVNGVAATATGNSVDKTVTITLPTSLALSNNAGVALSLPSSVICNPSAIASYTLSLQTSVETTPVVSKPYRISGPLVVGNVLVAPSQVGAPASYTIPLGLSSNGGLDSLDTIHFRFPVGTVVPNSIPSHQVTVDGVAATTVISNSITREVSVTVPAETNLPDGYDFSVVFNTGAGLINPPSAGNYTLEAWTSVQTKAIASPIYALSAGGGSAIATTTKSGYKKTNQSKVFYHNGQWWALAFYDPENRWYIWKFDGNTWTRNTNLNKGLGYHWDAVLNTAANKLYLFGSHISAPEFRRYSYTGGAWSKDSGYPVTVADFGNADQNNPVSLGRAKNDHLWIFRVAANKLQAKRSSDQGLTWSPIIDIKSGLATARGTTDAAAFTWSGNDYLGVAYAETDTVGSRFGFLHHRDADADNAWTDESAALTFFGNERAFNNICMATDANDDVYLLTRNLGTSGSLPRNTLYKRSAGVWQKFKINSTSAHNWKMPAIAIDDNPAGGVIYVMGVDVTTNWAEYKIGLIGDEAGLENAPVTTLFSGSGAAFEDLSVPAANVNAVTGLMVTADNTTASDIWYRQLPISGSVPVSAGAITLSDSEVNANAQYTIPLTLSSNGGLSAGMGMINFRFPNNTFLSSNMAASQVLVDGAPANTIIVNGTTRQVSITTPVNLSNNQAFSVVFNQAAGILNPTLVNTNYKITVWTSAQPIQIGSPLYGLVQATTTVTPATVAPFPSDADSLADYTLNFHAGNHGRLLSGNSTVSVKFGAATRVMHGAWNGVKINSVSTAATGDSALRQVIIATPASLSLTNNAAIALFFPKGPIRNPAIAGNFTLTVATSVETTAVASNAYQIKPNAAIGAPIPGTTKNFDRNNQSKLFYHGGFWWVMAQAKSDLNWYLWKFDGTTWSQHLLLHTIAKDRPDAVLDAENNKAYILLPGSSTTYLTRLSYTSGAWSIDAGYPYTIPSFVQSSDQGINLARASNGDLWAFMIADSTLLARHSTNHGQTWSANITVKAHLHNATGLTDAVAFVYNGQNHLGVGYAENSGAGAIYGFLRHKNSDAENVWTDETASVPQFAGTTADDHLSMAVHNNKILMIVKTNGGGASVVNVGLLHRATNAAWTQYPIFLSNGWTRPLLAVDATNNALYAMGTREGGVKVGEMKSCAIDDYSALLAASRDTIFMHDNDNFLDGSTAAHSVTGAMNLLVCNSNTTRDEVWYKLVTLGEAPKANAALAQKQEPFTGVQVYPNPFNPNTSFRFQVNAAAPVKLQIFNLNGQLVRTLADGEMTPGVHQKRWNGRNQRGSLVASGIYLYRLQIGQNVWKGRIQMIK